MYYANLSDSIFSLPGRARIKVGCLKKNEPYAERIERVLSQTQGIHSVETNIYTGTVLILYEEDSIGLQKILEQIAKAKQMILSPAKELFPYSMNFTREKQEYRKSIMKFAVSSTVLTGVVIKQFVFGRNSISSSMGIFAVSVGVTAFAGYPMLKRGLETLVQKGRLNADLILSICAWTCILLRECTLSLLVITMIYFNEVIMLHLINRLEKQLRNLLKHRRGTIRKLTGNEEIEVLYEEICSGDILEDDPIFENALCKYYHRFLPFVLLGSLAYFIMSRDVWWFLTMVLVACPKPNHLIASTAVRTAAMNAYANGIYVKEPRKLLALSRADTLIFDKTGTLTENKLKAKDILEAGNYGQEKILMIAASCEKHNRHPIASAIVEEAEGRGIHLKETKLLDYEIGRGIACIIDEKKAFVGNKEWMKQHNIAVKSHEIKERKLKHLGQSPLYVAYHGRVIGLIGIKDQIRWEALSTVEYIREQGILDIEIMSGDTSDIVENTAREVNIHQFYGEMTPSMKTGRIKELREEGRQVVMVGDGINDLPALRNADVGIAIANQKYYCPIDGADMIIMNDKISSIPSMIDLGFYTAENAYQNNILFFGINIIGIILAATKVLTPFMGVMYRDINNLIVFLNAMRPGKYNIKYLDGQVL
ncbi:MAG: heavy metal translocating P-type ATPase [Bacillota bacterium]